MYKEIQIFTFAQLVSELDHITHNEDGSYSFLVRDINTEKNKEYILSKMKFLKNIFKKIPPPNRYNKFLRSKDNVLFTPSLVYLTKSLLLIQYPFQKYLLQSCPFRLD